MTKHFRGLGCQVGVHRGAHDDTTIALVTGPAHGDLGTGDWVEALGIGHQQCSVHDVACPAGIGSPRPRPRSLHRRRPRGPVAVQGARDAQEEGLVSC